MFDCTSLYYSKCCGTGRRHPVRVVRCGQSVYGIVNAFIDCGNLFSGFCHYVEEGRKYGIFNERKTGRIPEQKKINFFVAFWTFCVMIDVCAHLAQTKADYEDSLLFSEDSLISKIKYFRRKETNGKQVGLYV